MKIQCVYFALLWTSILCNEKFKQFYHYCKVYTKSEYYYKAYMYKAFVEYYLWQFVQNR